MKPLTPRDSASKGGIFKSYEFGNEPTPKYTSFRSNTSQKPRNLNVKQPMQCLPYPEEVIQSRANTFTKKSMSAQEYMPEGTSSDLSKAIKNIVREDYKTPTDRRASSGQPRDSMIIPYNQVNSFTNQSSTMSANPMTAIKELTKHKRYKNKYKKAVKKVKELEQTNKELEFKLKFYEDKNKELTTELKEASKSAAKPFDSEKLKADKKRLLKKCKGLESTTKVQTKEIEILKNKLEIKKKQIKNYESDITGFKKKIKKFNTDIDEFK